MILNGDQSSVTLRSKFEESTTHVKSTKAFLTALTPSAGSLGTIKGLGGVFNKADTVKKEPTVRRTVFNGDAYKARKGVVSELVIENDEDVMVNTLSAPDGMHGVSQQLNKDL